MSLTPYAAFNLGSSSVVNTFINDLGDGTKCTLSKFADDVKVEGAAADTPEWCAAHPREGGDRLEKLVFEDSFMAEA